MMGVGLNPRILSVLLAAKLKPSPFGKSHPFTRGNEATPSARAKPKRKNAAQRKARKVARKNRK